MNMNTKSSKLTLAADVKRNRPAAAPLRAVGLLGATVGAVMSLGLLTACGNTWVSSKQRESSPSALKLKGDYAYDKANFADSTKYYQLLLDADPTNGEARIRLAYSLNAQADLAPFNLVEKLSALSTPAKTTGAAPATATSSITTFTGLVGLSDAEKALVVNANPAVTTAAQLRVVSKRFAQLHASWKVVCQLLPANVLASALGSDERLKTMLDVGACKGGLADASKVKTSALFAATMGSLAQASGLYQTILDDGKGNIKVVEQAKTVSASIETIQKSIAAETDPAKLSAKMTELSDNLAQLAAIGAVFQGELIALTLGHFGIVASMSAAIGLPDSVNASINKAVTSFNDAKGKINDYLAVGSSNSGASAYQAKIKDAATKASASVDEIYKKQPQTAENQAQLKKTCDNFDSFATTYKLPAGTAKPTSCSAASFALLNASPEKALALPIQAESPVAVSLTKETVQSADEPLALDENSRETQQGVVDFAIFGEEILR